MIEFGFTYRDRISGFEGVATGHVRYMTGCHQVLLQPDCSKSSTYFEPFWFDEQRVERVNDGTAIVLPERDAAVGSDKAAPKR